MSENKLQQINIKQEGVSGLEHIDLSGGFTCDMETGICGPTETIQKKKKLKEIKNENNNLV